MANNHLPIIFDAPSLARQRSGNFAVELPIDIRNTLKTVEVNEAVEFLPDIFIAANQALHGQKVDTATVNALLTSNLPEILGQVSIDTEGSLLNSGLQLTKLLIKSKKRLLQLQKQYGSDSQEANAYKQQIALKITQLTLQVL